MYHLGKYITKFSMCPWAKTLSVQWWSFENLSASTSPLLIT